MPAKKSSESQRNNSSTQHGQNQQISYQIAHAIPGRIRFRIPRLAKDSEYANKLKQVIEIQMQDAQVRVNRTAASIVISYPIKLGDEQIRLRLIQLIQTAPDITIRKPLKIRQTLEAVFDAFISLINSMRKINQAGNAIQYHQFRVNRWERFLATGESFIKRVKSSILFLLPHKQSQSSPALESA